MAAEDSQVGWGSRLCAAEFTFVRTKTTDAAADGAADETSKSIFWPCLRFSSFESMMSFVSNDGSASSSTTKSASGTLMLPTSSNIDILKLQARLSLDYLQQAYCRIGLPECEVLYFLGNPAMRKSDPTKEQEHFVPATSFFFNDTSSGSDNEDRPYQSLAAVDFYCNLATIYGSTLANPALSDALSHAMAILKHIDGKGGTEESTSAATVTDSSSASMSVTQPIAERQPPSITATTVEASTRDSRKRPAKATPPTSRKKQSFAFSPPSGGATVVSLSDDETHENESTQKRNDSPSTPKKSNRKSKSQDVQEAEVEATDPKLQSASPSAANLKSTSSPEKEKFEERTNNGFPTVNNEEETETAMEVEESVEEDSSIAQEGDAGAIPEEREASSKTSKKKNSKKNSSKKQSPRVRHSSKKKLAATPKSSAKKKATPTNSIKKCVPDETLDVPTFADVKGLLEQSGFTFPNGFYCLPGVSPPSNTSSSQSYQHSGDGNEGIEKGYFFDELSFRRYLCRHDVECFTGGGKYLKFDQNTKKPIYNASVGILVRYIRYAILEPQDILRNNQLIPILKLDPAVAIRYLQRLGFKYNCKDVFEGYSLPGVTLKEVNESNTFPEKPDLWLYLARHGLPSNCTFDNLDQQQVTYITQYIAHYGMELISHEEIFKKQLKKQADSSTRTERAVRRSRKPLPSSQPEEDDNSHCDESDASSTQGLTGMKTKMYQGESVEPPRRSSLRRSQAHEDEARTSAIDTASLQKPSEVQHAAVLPASETHPTNDDLSCSMNDGNTPGFDKVALGQSRLGPDKCIGTPFSPIQNRPSFDAYANDIVGTTHTCAEDFIESDDHEALANIQEVMSPKVSQSVSLQETDLSPGFGISATTHPERLSYEAISEAVTPAGFADQESEGAISPSLHGVNSKKLSDIGGDETQRTPTRTPSRILLRRSSRLQHSASKKSPLVNEKAQQASVEQNCAPKPAETDGDVNNNDKECAASALFRKNGGRCLNTALNHCKTVLQTSYRNSSISTEGLVQLNSSRLEIITQFLNNVVESNGKHGRQSNLPALLKVCGVPGAGKTWGVKKCCQDVKKYAKSIGEEPPIICHINAAHIQTCNKKSIKEIIVSHIVDAMQKAKSNFKGKKVSEKTFERVEMFEIKDPVLVVVIDEIDLLVSNSVSPSTMLGSEEVLKEFFDWAESPDLRFSLIGICNSVGNGKSRRLQELGMSDENVFNPYGKEDLITIVESRVGRSVVDPKLIEFAASKVSASSGDARRVLEFVSKAIDKCREKLSRDRLDENFESFSEGQPVVKLPHIMAVIREVNTKFTQLIDDLPTAAKTTLCIATTLARALDDCDASTLTLGELKQYTMDAMKHEYMSIDDFKNVLEMLVDSGLLKLTQKDTKLLRTESLVTLHHAPIGLDLQLEDVESAIDKTLLQEPFYQGLVERVKSQHC